MYFNIDNPFGTELFPAPAPVRVKSHKLPRTRNVTRVLRAPKSPSVILKNYVLS